MKPPAAELIHDLEKLLEKLRLGDLRAIELQLRAKLLQGAGQSDHSSTLVQYCGGGSADLGKYARCKARKAEHLRAATDTVSAGCTEPPLSVKGILLGNDQNPTRPIGGSAVTDFRHGDVRIPLPIAAVFQV